MTLSVGTITFDQPETIKRTKANKIIQCDRTDRKNNVSKSF